MRCRACHVDRLSLVVDLGHTPPADGFLSSAQLDASDDPWRPGDIILMDTFPSRPGPDHIGIISDTIGPSGLPLVINNWTNGTVTSEMDLLTFVPVLYRFRLAG